MARALSDCMIARPDPSSVTLVLLLDLVPDLKAFLGTGLDEEDLAMIRAQPLGGRWHAPWSRPA